MTFTQTMIVRAGSADELKNLLEAWHRDQSGVAPGYQGARLLADQDQAGRYVIEVHFSGKEEADRNNARPETQAWAEQLQEVAQAEPEYDNYELAYTSR